MRDARLARRARSDAAAGGVKGQGEFRRTPVEGPAPSGLGFAEFCAGCYQSFSSAIFSALGRAVSAIRERLTPNLAGARTVEFGVRTLVRPEKSQSISDGLKAGLQTLLQRGGAVDRNLPKEVDRFDLCAC